MKDRAPVRKAKVTPETKQESRRLLDLWETKAHPSQAEFGEKFAIGTQGMVRQCLAGEVPLSLKAARGFAEGLGCYIDDFSPRLAEQIVDLAQYTRAMGGLTSEMKGLLGELQRIPTEDRGRIVTLFRELLGLPRRGGAAELKQR